MADASTVGINRAATRAPRAGARRSIGVLFLLLLLVVMGCLLSACASKAALSPSRDVRATTRALATKKRPSLGTKRAVASAWREATMAMWRAKETGTLDAPVLSALLAPAMLESLEQDIQNLDEEGLRLIGPLRVGSPKVVVVSSHLARLQSCIDDEEIFVSITGAPVQSNMDDPGSMRVTATLARSSLGWILKAESSRPDPRCDLHARDDSATSARETTSKPIGHALESTAHTNEAKKGRK